MKLPNRSGETPLRILILEDKATEAELLMREVKGAGFIPEWVRVETEAEFLAELEKGPELILSDYSLPHFDGLSAVTLVRKRGLDTPFILVSGTLGEEAAVEAMTFGADDYLMKGRTVRLGLAIRRVLEEKRLRDDRKRATENMIRLNERFEIATRAAEQGIWDWDVTKNELVWDDQMFKLYGVKRQEVSGAFDAWINGLHPEDAARSQAEVQQAFSGEKEFNTEFRIVWPGGETRHLRAFARVTRDASGEPVRMTGVSYDITERKQVEDMLRKLSHAVEQSSSSIVITDRAGKIEYINPTCTLITGYSLDEMSGQNLRMQQADEASESAYEQLWAAITAGKEWRGELHNRKKNGDRYWESVSVSPIRDAAGSITNFLAVKEDTTARRELEEQFRQSQKMEGIGRLAGGVAHDFNNILAAIQLDAGLLRNRENVSPELTELADDIGEAVQRGAALTRQLLLFSRNEVLREQDLDLNQSIEGMMKMLRRTIGEDVEMQLKLSGQPMFLRADAAMLDQVLLNLVLNARDAMPAGGRLVIETSSADFDEQAMLQSGSVRQGSYICLSVSDTGHGVPREIHSKIFEPFFTTKPVGKGTGLGLATVFGIVQQHHGWINVDSEVDQGTTIRIYLPHRQPLARVKSADPTSTAMPGGKETVLVVEDDSAVRAVLKRSLSRLGYRVLSASDGNEALAVWRGHRNEIDLVLTDMVMPGGMNGIELGEKLLDENPKIKVVYMSGYSAEVASKDFPLEDGVNFLHKPFQPVKLAQTVRGMLDAGSAVERLADQPRQVLPSKRLLEKRDF